MTELYGTHLVWKIKKILKEKGAWMSINSLCDSMVQEIDEVSYYNFSQRVRRYLNQLEFEKKVEKRENRTQTKIIFHEYKILDHA